ncbi:ciliary microtubule inner protein 2B [Denticeps clupeoides]|uniref:ciliary microtubule inner protein 2B n=1 Tax=Denticeps clupeoides TaxID=299321 RepID=UPI0010A4045D|nr:protein FAM166B [Denticeps clupeoides]
MVYAGYCPQLKFHFGQTFGQLTAGLLSSSESRRSLLQSGRTACRETDPGSVDDMWRSRQRDRPQLTRTIPGYTGFIPKRQNYFSRTYTETCHDALAEFERDRQRRVQIATSDGPITTCQNSHGTKSRRLNTPLTAISMEPMTVKSPNPWKPCGSPYLMDENSPHKYFMSGFTGYVPKSRFLMGTSYPIATNKALIQFGREMRNASSSLGHPGDDAVTLPHVPAIYPPDRGLLPSYTGHVLGYRFRYGQTFGQSTHNALGINGGQRKTDVQT